MATIFSVSVVVYILAALYRSNEINPSCRTYKKLRYTVAGLDIFAFVLFLIGVTTSNPFWLAIVVVALLVGAYWLIGGQEWKSTL